MAQKVFTDTEYFKGGKFVIGTTVLKDLLADNPCPLKLYNKWWLGVDQPPTESMLRGSYFETLILGAGAKGKKVTDLPRNKDGSLKAATKRINYIATEIWPKVMNEYELIMDMKQVPLDQVLSDNFIMGTHLDILGRVMGEGAIVDIKLSANINSTFGDYSWGEPHLMDHSQATMCTMLVEHKYNQTAPFYYFVFDYKPENEYKVIRKNVTEHDKYELLRKLEIASEEYIRMFEAKWPANPTFENCNKCLVTECNKRIARKEIEFI